MFDFLNLINPKIEYEEAIKLQSAANGSFQRLIIAAMIQCHADENSKLSLTYPNIYQLYKRGENEAQGI